HSSIRNVTAGSGRGANSLHGFLAHPLSGFPDLLGRTLLLEALDLCHLRLVHIIGFDINTAMKHAEPLVADPSDLTKRCHFDLAREIGRISPPFEAIPGKSLRECPERAIGSLDT